LTVENREYCRQWHNQVEVTVPGTHFIQEQSSALVGTALADWLGDLNA
jgi:haloalkane dehalogenase